MERALELAEELAKPESRWGLFSCCIEEEGCHYCESMCCFCCTYANTRNVVSFLHIVSQHPLLSAFAVGKSQLVVLGARKNMLLLPVHSVHMGSGRADKATTEPEIRGRVWDC